MFITFIKQNKKELLWIFTAALAFRLIWFLTVFLINPDGFYFFDSHGYIELAQNILSKGEFGRISEGYFYKEHFRTPGYPLLISFFLLVFQQIIPLLLFQIIMAAAIPVLVYLISIELKFSKKTALFAGVLMAIDIPSILFATTVLSDTFFLFTFLSSVWLIILSKEKESLIFLILSALLIGFAVLIRPIGIFLPFFLLLFSRFKLKPVLKSLLFLSLSYLLVFSWIYRNNNIFGFKFLSTVSNVNLLHFRAAEVYAEKNNVTLQQARLNLEDKVLMEYENIEGNDYRTNLKKGFEISNKIAFYVLSKNPLITLKQAIKNGIFLLVKPARSYIDYQLGYKVEPFQKSFSISVITKNSIPALVLTVFQGLILIITWSAFILAVYINVKEKNFSVLLPLLLIVLFFLILSSGPEADARLRMPLMPFVFIVASSFLSKISKKLN